MTKSKNVGRGYRGPAVNSTATPTAALAPGSREAIDSILAAQHNEPNMSTGRSGFLVEALKYHRDEQLKQFRADLAEAKAKVATLNEKNKTLTTLVAEQGTRITQLETANAGLQAYKDAAHTEEERAKGQKAEDDKLAEIAEQARRDKAAKDEKIAAFIIERDKRKAEYERRINTPYQDGTSKFLSVEDVARIAHENNEQMKSNFAFFEDYKANWEDRTEPPPPPPPTVARYPWADQPLGSLTEEEFAERERVSNDPKSTDEDKRKVGILPKLPPRRRPGL